MARPESEILTPAEQRVLSVLWDRKEATVRDVVEALAAERQFAYTTVLTVLRVLVRKGYASAHAAGRAHVFSPLVSRHEARGSAVRHIIRNFFGNSPAALLEHLIEEGEIDHEGIRRLEARLDEEDKSA